MRRAPRTMDPRFADATLAALLTIGALLDVWLGGDGGRHRLGAALLASATIAPVAVRRRYPTLIGAGLPALAAVDHRFVDPQFVGYPIATFCAMYALAAWTPPRRFVLGLALFLAANVAVGGALSRIGLLYAGGSAVAMLLVRQVVRGRERRAELAERERHVAAREAVVEERARIARELHDALAHHLSIMVVQAGAERRVLDRAQGTTGETLATIEQTGRRTLIEVRRLLGLLRDEAAG
jgi:signal transduction histidine kinase